MRQSVNEQEPISAEPATVTRIGYACQEPLHEVKVLLGVQVRGCPQEQLYLFDPDHFSQVLLQFEGVMMGLKEVRFSHDEHLDYLEEQWDG